MSTLPSGVARPGAEQPHGNALVGRREAHRIVGVQRHQRVGLWIVGGAASHGERVGHELVAAHAPLDAVLVHRDDVDAVAGLEAEPFDLGRAEEDDVALAVDATVAVGHRVERRVVLVVAAHAGQPQHVIVLLRRAFLEYPYGQIICPTDAPSRRLTMIVAQEPTQSLAAPHRPLAVPIRGARKQQDVALPLVVPLGVEMVDVFAQR